MISVPAVVEEIRYRGEPALRLRVGTLEATFLPRLGMTGVSLRHADGEYLAVRGGLDTLRAGKTAGLPLMAPWANRVTRTKFRIGGANVDLTEAMAAGRVRPDDNGLPIHGLVTGRSIWKVSYVGVLKGVPTVRASLELDDPAFPIPHRIDVSAAAHEDRLVVDTTVTPTARRGLPVAFGWHPYLRVPETPRSRWHLRMPARTHQLLDARGIPTGKADAESAEDAPLGSRLFDDLYAFAEKARPAGRRLAFVGDNGRSVELRCDDGYPLAQVWVPEARPFAALEPMTSPTNAIVAGTAPIVAPGDSFSARFSLVLTGPDS